MLQPSLPGWKIRCIGKLKVASVNLLLHELFLVITSFVLLRLVVFYSISWEYVVFSEEIFKMKVLSWTGTVLIGPEIIITTLTGWTQWPWAAKNFILEKIVLLCPSDSRLLDGWILWTRDVINYALCVHIGQMRRISSSSSSKQAEARKYAGCLTYWRKWC